MAPTYYVIELTARWLTVLLVALALVMVLAFVFGYGAAWSVLTAGDSGAETTMAELVSTPTPTPVEVVITAVPEEPTRAAVASPVPQATATPRPRAVVNPQEDQVEEFWVQVFASSKAATIEAARGRLRELGFGADNQRVESTMVAGGRQLHKLRVGPFPDRESADRVARRMRDSGYPDAWIVSP